jgi:hypothetical protein
MPSEPQYDEKMSKWQHVHQCPRYSHPVRAEEIPRSALATGVSSHRPNSLISMCAFNAEMRLEGSYFEDRSLTSGEFFALPSAGAEGTVGY